MVWNAGQRVSKGYYVIEQKLGEGRFGITYRATNPEGHFEVIKTLRDKIDGKVPSEKLRQDFYEEAAVLFKLRDSHRHDPIVRHLVQVNNLFMEADLPCFAMEYIPGKTLGALMKEGTLPETEALQYIEQIGKALELVHKEKMLHRDISPDNIMLREGKSEAVLIDFGIARKFIPGVEQTQTICLRRGYAPPEQYDSYVQQRSFIDVYALAATLYAVLTVRHPVEASIRKNACDARQTDPLQPLIQVNPNVSVRVSEAVMWGMTLNYRQRPQSVSSWLARLLGQSSGASSATTTLPPATSKAPPARSKTLVLPAPQPLLLSPGWHGKQNALQKVQHWFANHLNVLLTIKPWRVNNWRYLVSTPLILLIALPQTHAYLRYGDLALPDRWLKSYNRTHLAGCCANGLPS